MLQVVIVIVTALAALASSSPHTNVFVSGKVRPSTPVAFSEDYGPYIVEISPAFQLSAVKAVIEALLPPSLSPVLGGGGDDDEGEVYGIMVQYHKVLYGFAVHGLSRTVLERLEAVNLVEEDGLEYPMAYSWGTDRIDQTNLPLNNESYSPDFHGVGVDVYVTDTGVDCNHVEFAANEFGRVCENIYNAFGELSTNTDGGGHGTHCAGTALVMQVCMHAYIHEHI
jgi:subtilisin family serine protease